MHLSVYMCVHGVVSARDIWLTSNRIGITKRLIQKGSSFTYTLTFLFSNVRIFIPHQETKQFYKC